MKAGVVQACKPKHEEDCHEFKASLGYIANTYLKDTKIKRNMLFGPMGILFVIRDWA